MSELDEAFLRTLTIRSYLRRSVLRRPLARRKLSLALARLRAHAVVASAVAAHLSIRGVLLLMSHGRIDVLMRTGRVGGLIWMLSPLGNRGRGRRIGRRVLRREQLLP